MPQTLILKRLSYPNTKYLVCSHLSIEGDPHLYEKERSDFSLPSTGCAESHPSGTEGGFSEQDIHVTPKLDMLIQIHDRRPKASQVIVEFATDESFLAAVHQKRKQPLAI